MEKNAAASCPSCGDKGRSIKPITVASLLTNPATVPAPDGFLFCKRATCDVVYFHPRRGRVTKRDVRVPVFQKEADPARLVCYCFAHSVAEIEADVQRTGDSQVFANVTDKCRQGLDRCEEENPQGSCCLGNVRQVIQKAQADMVSMPETPVSDDALDCCALPPNESSAAPRRNVGLWSAGGALLAAILSSACCWLPLALIAVGASAAGVAGFFAAYRVHLLIATAALLGTGFYYVYFRKPKCAPGDACAVPNPRLQRFNKIMLWIATAFVLIFAAFPNYVGYLLGGDTTGP